MTNGEPNARRTVRKSGSTDPELVPARRRRTLRLGRDSFIFIVGLGGIVYQTLFVNTDRPTLLLLFGAMIGLPAFLRLDERDKNGK